MSTHVALLRGINVGGKNKLPMRELAALFEAEGCGDVRTFIQSGNVLFDLPSARVATLGERISARIHEGHDLTIPVVLRTARELAAAAAHNPFAAGDTAMLHVMFLRDKPSAAKVKALDAERSPGDRFTLVGRDLYLRLPNGVARTKLTNAYFDRALDTVSTLRNWRTVQKLAEMAAG
jgi:uncharacterized protein (DUF1697 family)